MQKKIKLVAFLVGKLVRITLLDIVSSILRSFIISLFILNCISLKGMFLLL